MNWYVINGEDHLGPFSEDVLRQLYEAHDIEDSTLIWQEGMEAPIEFQVLFNQASDQANDQANESNEIEDNEESLESEEIADEELPPDLPPDLPPIPTSEFLERDEIEESLDSDLEQIIKDRDNVLQVDFGSSEEENKGVIIIEDEEEYEEHGDGFFSLAFRRTLIKVALFTVVLIIGSFGFIYYKNYSGSFDRPAKMAITDYQKLQSIVQNTNRENKFAFSIAQDKSKIWLVTNNPYVGRVVLKMKSLTGKVLSSKDIELSSIGMLRGKLAEFSQFEFQKGQNVVDGYYEIEVLTPTTLEIPWIAKFFPEKKRRFRFIDQILISNMKASEFDRELNNFNTSRARNDIVFWEELNQKYSTLKAITTQIRDSIKNIFQLNRNDWNENIASFEKTYLTKYGSYFTNFVVDNEQAYEKYKEQDFTNKTEVISHYVRLSRLAREVGTISVNAMDTLKKFKDVNDNQKMKALERLVTTPFDRIINDCEEKINFIQTK